MIRVLAVLIAAGALTGCATRTVAVDDARQQAADASATATATSEAYLADIDLALAMAERGEYGRIRAQQMIRLRSARHRIARRLEGVRSPAELPTEERVKLFNDQEYIRMTLAQDEKERMVCRFEAATGSRLAVNVCMTVAEREARARAGREDVDNLNRLGCIPGEGNPCRR